ncbi:hypothetical protein BS623_02730 [Vibrio parahaemolyticus]|uniref:SIR2 family NAD-dependent protein deacylase n=1 Tax=Vibrio parahaemolyticus TaxID=670 RepID=UPI000A39DE49|nr:Sir2 family NAD-dependent protein deacetylase [Vibrio parahaemolyticus]EHP3974649.1 hypothetical protein [Vibrio parahaemolyticus]MBM4935535.1 hypothetical protein [Vibrio parahaemolyticus]OUD42578.1 hypothetical protein BS623_02730 [Vibrio parahaemolyticus]OUJ47819.1 hypothetical protein BTZ53_05745 [Vibrio parahaemolyticus]
MKLVVLSGAGLSSPSGMPTYDEIKLDHDYLTLQSAQDEEIALAAILSLRARFSLLKPNSAHRELAKLSNYCQAHNIELIHYTLNVDDLAERAGGVVHHLHGTINDPKSILDNKDVVAFDLSTIKWESGDLMVILGVSNNGYPLANLESEVTAYGGSFLNFNIVNNDDLNSQTIVGCLLDTFTVLDISQHLHSEFEIIDLGDYETDIKTFTINERTYEVYFTPTQFVISCEEEQQELEELVGQKLDHTAYEVKFDLQSNRESDSIFKQPNDNFTLSELNLLGMIIASSIKAHSSLRQVTLYTASAAQDNLVPFYNRLAKVYASRLQYDHWCGFGPEGVNYAFKKQ